MRSWPDPALRASSPRSDPGSCSKTVPLSGDEAPAAPTHVGTQRPARAPAPPQAGSCPATSNTASPGPFHVRFKPQNFQVGIQICVASSWGWINVPSPEAGGVSFQQLPPGRLFPGRRTRTLPRFSLLQGKKKKIKNPNYY